MRDKLDAPIVGATVSDGSQSTLTDSIGRYTLVETNQGTYTIRAFATGYVQQESDVFTLSNTADVDFTLPFKLDASVAPAYFNSLPTTLTLGASSLSPSDTDVTASISGSSPVTLTWTGLVNGKNNWQATVAVPVGTPDATFTYQFRGHRNSELVSDIPPRTYMLDRVLPFLSSPRATPNGSNPLATRSTTPTIQVNATDDRSGIDPASVTASVSNAQGTLVASGPGSLSSGVVTYQIPAATPLTDGGYSAVIGIKDRARNSATISFTFVVDTAKPTVLDPAPNDEITTATPEISAKIDDPGPAALDPPSMSLDGVGVAATYDADSLTLSYTPIIPLVPGKHRVVASATDAAGNSQSLGWHFWVLHRLLDDFE